MIIDRCVVLDDAKAAAVQERVLAKAPDQTWAQLDAPLRRAILAVDPDGAAEWHQVAKKERRADLLAAALTGKLVIGDAEAADLVQSTPVTPGKPLITVSVPYPTLTGADDEPCEIAGYGPIPAHLARDIAADAVWKRLVTDPLSGAVLDHGRTTYRPPAALADFVRARDAVCRHPRSRRAATACELDHVIPWDPDGATNEADVATLCAAHHDLKERSGWEVVLHSDRRMG